MQSTLNPLAGYLEKFKELLGQSRLTKDAVAEAVSLFIKTKLPAEAIVFRDNKVYITSTPAAKSELFLQSRRLSEELEKVLNKKVVIR